MRDRAGFGSNDPVMDQQTGQLKMPDAPQSPQVKAVGEAGKSVLNFLGDSQGNTTEVTGNVSMTVTYQNTDANAPQAMGYQVIMNKGGRFLWQDSGYVNFATPLSVGETSPSLQYDLSQLTDVGSFYSFQVRLQMANGVITPASDPVTFTLGAAQGTGGQTVATSSSDPQIELYQADGVTLQAGTVEVLVGAQPSQEMSLQLTVQHDSPVVALEISFVPALPLPSTGANDPLVSHVPQVNSAGGVNDQVQITWSPTAEQIGTYTMTITQADVSGRSTAQDVLVKVEDGTPIVAPAGDVMQQLIYSYDSVW